MVVKGLCTRQHSVSASACLTWIVCKDSFSTWCGKWVETFAEMLKKMNTNTSQ